MEFNCVSWKVMESNMLSENKNFRQKDEKKSKKITNESETGLNFRYK